MRTQVGPIAVRITDMPVAYPELVSGGGGVPSHTFKWLLKVGASKSVIRVDLKKNMVGGGGGGGSGQPEKPHGYATACF